jgi:hypothetical protein
MVPLTGWLAIAALVGPMLTYGAMSVKSKVEVYRAVQLERTASAALCESKIKSVAAEVNTKSDATIAAAEAAERAVSPTPPNKAELLALCKASASCRERKP